MIFEQELKDKGFEVTDGKIMREFSDFEWFTAHINEHVCADGSLALAINHIRLVNPMDKEEYAHISYPLYFRDINKFYELLTLLGYGLSL